MTSDTSLLHRLTGLLLTSVIGVSLGFGCRKAAPDEVVNGGDLGSGGNPSGSGGTGNQAGSAGSTSLPDGGLELHCEAPEPHADPTFTKQKLLEAAADCAAFQYCRFEGAAGALREAASGFAATPDAQHRDTARAAWQQAINAWEEAELFSFGPAAASTEPGGKDFRNLIYSWPLNGRCKVDEQIVSRFYETPDFFGPPTRSLINGRTLSALEYLAYYEGTDNGCHQLSPINSNRTWAAIEPSALTARKAAYAAAAAEDVFTQARALVQAWQPEQGNFRATLTQTGNPVFASEQAALNAISDAMFYLEKQVKDQKLGVPLGLLPECPSPPCVDAVESRWANASLEHVRSNLRGFRGLFQGCGVGNAGIGFDDWLVATGSADLADRMLRALDAADAAATGLDQPLQQLLVADLARVRALHEAIRGVTTLLKTEFVTNLNLELPATSEGDND
ncbi:MAG TPA: imelysin family protein [Polyangiaceae bacterium]|nr:imelysin family protein [Polyangiaceae bacterium]